MTIFAKNENLRFLKLTMMSFILIILFNVHIQRTKNQSKSTSNYTKPNQFQNLILQMFQSVLSPALTQASSRLRNKRTALQIASWDKSFQIVCSVRFSSGTVTVVLG